MTTRTTPGPRTCATVDELVGDERVARIVSNPSVPLRTIGRRRSSASSRSASRRSSLNLVRLLDQRGRLTLLPAIAAEFTRLLDAMRGIVAATVTSAAPLDKDEVTAISRPARIDDGRRPSSWPRPWIRHSSAGSRCGSATA